MEFLIKWGISRIEILKRIYDNDMKMDLAVALVSTLIFSYFVTYIVIYMFAYATNNYEYIKYHVGIVTVISIFFYAIIFTLKTKAKLKEFRNYEVLAPQSANRWDRVGPLRIFAPSQGLNLIYPNSNALKDDLTKTYSAIFEFKRQAEDIDISDFLIKVLENHLTKVSKILDRLEDEDFKAAERYEFLLEQGAICHPKSTVGTLVYASDSDRKDDSRSFGFRLLAFIMFFKVENEDLSFEPLADTETLEEFFAKFPNLRETGQFRVLYELSLTASRSLAEINREKDEIQSLKSELEQALANARATLKLKPAANRWQRSARISSILALVGLAPFLFLLIGVPWALWANWADVGTALSTLFHAATPETRDAIRTWQGFFKDAPWATFVFVTVPVLMFAWTLKHFSRIFVQNMNLASDASRRAALADVYTRIVSDPDLNREGNAITDDQKKIIFEAMFQPRDPRHTDDGIDHTPMEKAVAMVKDKGK